MKKNTLFLLIISNIFIAYSDDQNAIETVLEEVRRGAVLSILQFNNGDDAIGVSTLYTFKFTKQ